MPKNIEIGAIGEKAAAYFIVKNNFKIVMTNYRKPYGEIDIVAKKEGVIRFIEVKTNRYYPNSAFTPEIRVDAKKRRNLRRLCEAYLAEKRISYEQPWQIDVISVIFDGQAVRGINFLENAVFERKY